MLAVARALVGAADVVKCNAGEAKLLTGERTARDAAAALLSLGPNAAVVTCGVEGVLAATEGATAHEPAAAGIAVVDATGAGDSVAGVLAAALAARAPVDGLSRVLPLAIYSFARWSKRLTEMNAVAVVGSGGAVAGWPPAEESRVALRAAVG